MYLHLNLSNFIVLWCRQVALNNTKKKLEVSQQLFEGEEEVDLYTDKQINGGQRVRKEESPHSNQGVTQNNASSASSSSVAMPAREDIHVSTLNCQLTKMSPQEQDIPNSACAKEGKLPCEESAFNKDPQPQSQQAGPVGLSKSLAEADNLCSCLQSPDISLKLCIQCSTLHNVSCALLQNCIMQDHYIELPDPDDLMTATFSQGGSGGGASCCTAAASPSVIHDNSASMGLLPKPNCYHHCCNLAQLDPQVLCLTCGFFHSSSCKEIDLCQKHHKLKLLGVCSCGLTCDRTPLVLCRYCGNEYCRQCWYRSPVMCTCGQTFDQSPVWFFFKFRLESVALSRRGSCLKPAMRKTKSRSQMQTLPWHRAQFYSHVHSHHCL